MRIGTLALQGGFAAHGRVLTALGHEVVEVRYVEQLDDLDGIVLPGGESTTQLKLIDQAGMTERLDDFVRSGKPTLTTCAGTILAARTVCDPAQDSFGWVDITVSRNAWGRQVHSFEGVADGGAPEFVGTPLTFIRAPRITDLGEGVEVLVALAEEPVMVRQGNVVAATFHPELNGDTRVQEVVFGRG